jgi:hypothetical protein
MGNKSKLKVYGVDASGQPIVNVGSAGSSLTLGSNSVTLNTTGTTVLSLPNSGTVATLQSPAFTGTPTAPTASPGTNTTQLATTAFVLANTVGTGGVATLSFGSTGLTPNTATNGNITVAGTLAVANGGTGVTASTGSGSVVLNTSPTLVAPNLGTPTTLVATNATGTATGLTSGVTNALKNATGTVDVSAGIAPVVGQVLTATNGTTATWQTPTSTNIIGGVTGSLPYQTATSTTSMLGIGTPGQVLTVASGGSADPYAANVSLLMNMDGVSGSTTFTDSTNINTPVSNGGAVLSTATSGYYGSAAGLFNGSTSYVSVPHNVALNLTSGDFTVEARIYPTAFTSGNMSIINKDGVAGTSYAQYDLSITPAGKLNSFLGNGNGVSPTGTTYTGATTITLNQWHHVAVVKLGSTCYGFLDGVQQWSSTAATMYDGGKPVIIGYQTGQPSSTYFNGLIEDVRITKGYARYSANFTPPASGLVLYGAIPSWSTPASTSVTLTGDITGTGTGTVATTLANSGVTAGTYKSVTTDAKGRVTAGTNPTTLSGFGITDAVNTNQLGAASGVATLDATGKLTTSQIPASLVGALQYQGTWNASTNTPTLTSGSGTKGQYYKVSVAGSTLIDGVSQWVVGDMIVFDGTTWDKIDGSATEVTSVAGRVGAITLSSSDISGLAASATTDTTNASNISSGTLGAARLPAFTGDATSSVGTSALTLAASGVTAGTYTKVTVDAKGRVTTGASIASSDVTTALGFTPYNATNPSGYITSSDSITGNAATATNVQGGAAGSVHYQSAANTTAMLGIGTTGQVLTVSGGLPVWSTPTSGGTSGISALYANATLGGF